MLDQVEGTVASLLLPSQDHQCYILRVMTPLNTLIEGGPMGVATGSAAGDETKGLVVHVPRAAREGRLVGRRRSVETWKESRRWWRGRGRDVS